MVGMTRRINRWQAALLLAAAALALAAVPLRGLEASGCGPAPNVPCPPTGVSATDIIVTATSATVTLTWNPVGNAASYGVWRSGAGAEYTTGTSHTFTGLYPHRTYNFNVWTRTADGATGPGAGTQVTMPARPGVPQTTPPTNMTLSDVTDSSVTVSWSGVAGATAYQIMRSGVGRTTLAGDAQSHTFTGLTAGQGYSVWIWAIGHGGISNNVRRGFTTMLLTQPDGLTTTATASSITLSWTAVTGAASYEVKHSPGGETPTTVTGTSHPFNGLTAGTAYTLFVRAKNGSGESAWSEVPKTTVPAAPSASDLKATATSTSLTLSWPAVTGADSYDVKLGTTETAVPSGASYTFPNLTANTAYTLSVRARNGSGTSPWASLSPTTAPAKPFAEPGIFALWALRSPTHTNLSWTNSTGATHHEVKLGPDGEVKAASGDDGYNGWHDFENLVPNVQYTFYVRAANSWGASEWVGRTAPGTTAPPPAPSDPKVTASTTTSLELSWTAARPSNTTTYEVKRSPGSATPTTADRINGNTFSHTFSGLTAGTAYTLYVRATDGGRPSAWSQVSATTALVAPTGLNRINASIGSNNDDSLTLSWNAVPGAASYEVKRSPGSETPTTVTRTSHTFTSLNGYTEYTFYVRGKKNDQTSDWGSITASVGGKGGLGRVQAASTSTSITVCCFGSMPSSVTKFKLGASGAVATVRGSAYTFTGLTPATVYTLHSDGGVLTLSEGHVHYPENPPNGPTTSQWPWRTVMTAPEPPSGLRATLSSTGLTLSWSAVTGATRYDVKLDADGPPITVPSGGTSYTFTSLTASTEYALYVHARNSGGSSEWRSVKATTASTLPSPSLNGLTVTDSTSSSVTLSWNAVPGAASYEVKRSPGSETLTTVTRTSHPFTGLTAGTRYALYVRGKNSTETFPWRSITAKTELPEYHGFDYLRVSVTSSSITFPSLSYVSSRTSLSEFKLGVNGAVSSGASHTFTGLAADTEYTLYGRSRSGTEALPWRSIITVKTRPWVQSGVSAMATSTDVVLLRPSRNGVMNATNYVLRFAKSESFTTGWASGDYLGLPRDAHALPSGTEYAVYVRPANSVATADWTTIATTTAPAQPSRLSATATSASLTLRWAVMPGATGYRVKLGENGTAIAVTGTSHTFTGLTADTEYTLYVYAKNRGGNSEWSSITATTALTAPPAP